MLILSIDSSQPVGSVTLGRAQGAAVEILETVESHGGKFSAQLIPTVKRLLESHALHKKDIDVIAAASGPGTFTGLRVGLAAVKALAEVLGTPIVVVSVLEALASAGGAEAIAITDAGKGQWYVRNGEQERHLSGEQLQVFAADHGDLPLVTSAELPQSLTSRAQRIATPISELVAKVGAGKAARKEFVAIDALDANYVRADEGLFRTS